jgi:Exoribonuclease II
MRKERHDDRISTVIHTGPERASAEPEDWREPSLTRFGGKVHKKDDRMSIVPDHPPQKDAITSRADRSVSHDRKEGEWAVAETPRQSEEKATPGGRPD